MQTVLVSVLLSLVTPVFDGSTTWVAEGRVRGQRQPVELQRIPFRDRGQHSLWMNSEAVPAFIDLVEAANSAGFHIRLNSAYRTYAHQRRLWLKMPGIAGDPNHGGTHTHQTGYSIDIDGTQLKFVNSYINQWEKRNRKKMDLAHCDKHSWGYKCPTQLYWWLRKNAKRYGFINDVKSERWHWTYKDL